MLFKKEILSDLAYDDEWEDYKVIENNLLSLSRWTA